MPHQIECYRTVLASVSDVPQLSLSFQFVLHHDFVNRFKKPGSEFRVNNERCVQDLAGNLVFSHFDRAVVSFVGFVWGFGSLAVFRIVMIAVWIGCWVSSMSLFET